MRILTLAVLLISSPFFIAEPRKDKPKVTLEEIADKVAELLTKIILDLNNQQLLTKEALRTEGQKTEVISSIAAKINSQEMKINMDKIKRRDRGAQRAPKMIYDKVIRRVGPQLGKEAKAFLKSPIETSVKNYLLKQEVAGTPITKKEGETSIEELADRVVDILKTVVLEMAKNHQLSKQTLADSALKAEAVSVIEAKINSLELKKNMDRIKRRDPKATTAPSLLYNKLKQTVQGQLGDDPHSGEVILQVAMTSAVKNYILKQDPVH